MFDTFVICLQLGEPENTENLDEKIEEKESLKEDKDDNVSSDNQSESDNDTSSDASVEESDDTDSEDTADDKKKVFVFMNDKYSTFLKLTHKTQLLSKIRQILNVY